MRIAELRREYNLGSLRRDDLEPNPLTQFANWLGQARAARGGGRLGKFFVGFYKLLLMVAGAPPLDVTAMTLATADKSGRPSARVVLLKNVDERGFVFFTNYESRKGRELTENPQAALVFYWPDLERQVCVSGNVIKLPEQESDDYFKSRPRASRLAAWASRQSQVIADKAQLVQQWIASETRFQQQEPPRPDFWGGYVLSPTRIEFWQGGPSRLHDRFCYTRQADKQWVIERLSP